MDLNAIWSWICANPIVFAILVITEILPFLPTEANGVAQGLINILGKIGKPAALGLLLLGLLNGCAYNSMTITADNESIVFCTGTVDKPVSVSPAIQGNVPIQGGSVLNPAQNVGK